MRNPEICKDSETFPRDLQFKWSQILYSVQRVKTHFKEKNELMRVRSAF